MRGFDATALQGPQLASGTPRWAAIAVSGPGGQEWQPLRVRVQQSGAGSRPQVRQDVLADEPDGFGRIIVQAQAQLIDTGLACGSHHG